MAYRFANQSEVKELEAWCMDILHAVQDEVREYFTFDIRLIGSGDKRLVTQNSDECFDLDYNIILQKDKKGLLDNPKQIKDIFVARFNKVLSRASACGYGKNKRLFHFTEPAFCECAQNGENQSRFERNA